MHNENYRRPIYVRYADDFIVLIASTIKYAISLKEKIETFLKEVCGLELNDQITTFTNTRKGFMFLGAGFKRRNNSSIFNSFLGKAEKNKKKLREVHLFEWLLRLPSIC